MTRKLLIKRLLPLSKTWSAGAAASHQAASALARHVGVLGILLVTSIGFVQAQTLSVSGVVTNEKSEPIVGVSVVVKGTTMGVATGVNGDYTIMAPADAVLVFSFVGMTSKEEPVNSRGRIDVQLSENAREIDEVVVVGYGQMKRSDLTGSVVSVGADALSKAIVTSPEQILNRAAGVQIAQNSGMPGGSTSIRIRGINSLNASNEPIFVIDGVVIDAATGSNTENALSSINAADIVSMDVLKDASATAIYGARGANGVIIITTKRGKSGEARISYDGYYGLQSIPKTMDLLDLRQYALHKNIRTDLGIVTPDNNFVRADLLGEGTDWQKELFSTAVMHSHNLSVSGGSETSTYALGAGYLNQDGIAIGSGFERLNLRGAFDAQLKKFLKMGINFDFSNSKQVITIAQEGLIETALKQTPNVAVRNADGSYDGPETDQYVQNNPVGLAMIKDNRNERTGIRANTYAEATIIEGLTFKTEVSLDYGIGNTYRFDPSYAFGALVNDTREGTQTKSYNKFYNWRNVLTYAKSVDVHSFQVMLGQEMQKAQWEYLSGYRSGYLTNGATDLDAGDAVTARNASNSGANSLLSYFGRLFYSYDNRYLLTATLRRDGSSQFTAENRWGWFPSVAAAWKISSESFFKGSALNDYMENLKLRVGYGSVGNQNVPSYATTSTFGTVATNWGIGLLSNNTPNERLKWESTYSGNIGLDLNMFHNRIELIADVYYKETSNLLLQLPLPAYAGSAGQGSAASPWANVGSLQNKGLELTLNTVNVDNGNFSWRSSLVYSMNRNKVLSLDTETSIINKTIQSGSDITVVTRSAVGEPIGQFYGYQVVGRFEQPTDFYYKDQNGNIQPVALPEGMAIGKNGAFIGDLIFADINKDGVINEEDRTYIGNPEPKFTFGFGNTFSYMGIDLNIYLAGSVGNSVVNWQRRFLENPRENTNLLDKALGYARLSDEDETDYRLVTVTGGDSDMPRIASSSAASNSNFRFSDRFVEDGSYLRIQNISVGYTFPQRWMKKLYIQNLRVYVNLQNVYTLTGYSGYDPEIGSYQQDALMTGIDNGRYPSPRIYTFGVNLTF
jgi:TonB-linked SusC/RagA family outer membrane protein